MSAFRSSCFSRLEMVNNSFFFFLRLADKMRKCKPFLLIAKNPFFHECHEKRTEKEKVRDSLVYPTMKWCFQ